MTAENYREAFHDILGEYCCITVTKISSLCLYLPI